MRTNAYAASVEFTSPSRSHTGSAAHDGGDDEYQEDDFKDMLTESFREVDVEEKDFVVGACVFFWASVARDALYPRQRLADLHLNPVQLLVNNSLHTYLSVWLSIHPSIYLPIYLSIIWTRMVDVLHVYMYISVYIHTHMHTYMHAYIHTYIHTYITYIHTYIHHTYIPIREE